MAYSIGDKFGMLLIVELLEDYKALCVCECGEYFIAHRGALRQGTQRSCGCAHTSRGDARRAKHAERCNAMIGTTISHWKVCSVTPIPSKLDVCCRTCDTEKTVSKAAFENGLKHCKVCPSTRAIHEPEFAKQFKTATQENGRVDIRFGKNDTRSNSQGLFPMHQLVAEQGLGRPLNDSIETVSHRDGDPSNNDADNIIINFNIGR